MTPEQADRLGRLLATRRAEVGLSANEVARRAGVDVGTVSRIEHGQIASPKAESLQAIGHVLDLPASDLFAIAGWVPKSDLPTLRPYLRTKYRNLPDDAVRDIEAHFDFIAHRYGVTFDPTTGPTNKEDE